MTQYALVNSDDQIIRVASNVDPSKASVKPGLRWIEVEFDGAPATEFHAPQPPHYDNGRVLVAYECVSPLAEVQGVLKARVDDRAEVARAQFVTRGSGQALTYEAKGEEARRWVAAGEPDTPNAADYPWASDRAIRTNTTLADVLAEWRDRALAWQAAGIAIESIRESAKSAISAAEDVEAACAAFAAVDWSVG